MKVIVTVKTANGILKRVLWEAPSVMDALSLTLLDMEDVLLRVPSAGITVEGRVAAEGETLKPVAAGTPVAPLNREAVAA